MKPKVLFVYPYLPSPDAAHGSARIVSKLLESLRESAAVSLLCVHRPSERHLVESVRPLCHRLHAVERRFKSEMGRARRVTEVGRTGVRWLTGSDPVPVIKLRRDAIRNALRRARHEDQPDLLHIELATMAQYRRECEGLPSVLVDHEAAGDRADPRWEAYARSVYPLFDRLLCLSAADGEEIRSVVPAVQPIVRAPALSLPPLLERQPEEDRVLFFGSLDHAPNRDALQWIAHEIMPALRKLRPAVKIVAAGFPPESAPEALAAQAAGVEVLGFVQDLQAELAKARCVIAPVRLGTGVRIKNLETLAAGLPLVTTTLGMRGLPESVARVADTAEAFAEAVAAELAQPPEATAVQRLERRDAVLAAHDVEVQAAQTLDLWRELIAARAR